MIIAIFVLLLFLLLIAHMLNFALKTHIEIPKEKRNNISAKDLFGS